MVQSFSLKAQSREIIKKQVKSLRSSGLVPSVVYGKGENPINISTDVKEFRKVFIEAGTSSLIDLKVGDEKAYKVIINDVQEHPVTGDVVHIDFYKVKMDEEIRTEIPLEFIGESVAVKDLDGSLVTNRDNIEVECLPSALVSQIEVDISKLATFEDQITVADLKIPEGIKVLTEAEEVIALVEEPRSEEELAELEESAADQEKEAIEQIAGEEAKEGEEPTESEATEEKEDK